jgi:hypothetical protein
MKSLHSSVFSMVVALALAGLMVSTPASAERDDDWGIPHGETCGAAQEGSMFQERAPYLSAERRVYCHNGIWRIKCPSSPAAAHIGCFTPEMSIFGGFSPDRGKRMFVTMKDNGKYKWNDGSRIWIDTELHNCVNESDRAAQCSTGRANTEYLVGLGRNESPAPYIAARFCDGLKELGREDWYLPAQNELKVLFDNRVIIGGFNLAGGYPDGYYWSSSERSFNGAAFQSFAHDSRQGSYIKDYPLNIRCVRN